jgi:ABC-type Na+ efflux pump permease subunit
MKKKYIYFAPPLVALVLFIAYYLHFRTGYDQEQEQVAVAAQRAKEETVREQNAQRKKAVDEALASQAKHKADKEARDAFLVKRQEERQAALDAREKSLSDLIKFREKAEKLRKDVTTVKEEITKIQQDEELLKAQVVFFQAYVQKAEVNDKALTAVLEKIQKADDARAAAIKAAAAAKKS